MSHTIPTKKLQAQFEQSLMSAYTVLVQLESKNGMIQIDKVASMLQACAANLAQGLDEQVLDTCDHCAALHGDRVYLVGQDEVCYDCNEKYEDAKDREWERKNANANYERSEQGE